MKNHALKTLLSKNSVADPDPPIQYKLMQIRNTVSPGYGNRYEMTKEKKRKSCLQYIRCTVCINLIMLYGEHTGFLDPNPYLKCKPGVWIRMYLQNLKPDQYQIIHIQRL